MRACIGACLSHWSPPSPSPSRPRFPFQLLFPHLLTVMDVDHEVKLLREEIMRLGTKNDKGVTRYEW